MTIEFAFLFPIIILLLGTLYEFSRAFQALNQLNMLVGQIATTWADCNDSPAGTCNTEMLSYSSAYANLAPNLVTANMGGGLWQVSVSGGAVTMTYGLGPLTAAATSAALANIPSGHSGVVCIITYTYFPQIFTALVQPWIGSSGIPFSQTAVALKS